MPSADLLITKSGSPNPVGIGQPLIYSIAVRNNGPDIATGVMCQDTIQSGVLISNITVTQGTYCYTNDTITWDVGVLFPGEFSTMEVTVVATEAGTIGNTANAYFNNDEMIDPYPDNNTVNLEVTVTPTVDLSLVKISCPEEALVEAPFHYTLVVINNGPSIANNVMITDTLPSEITAISAVSSQGNVQIIGNTVDGNLGSLDKNARATIRITATPHSVGTFDNTAFVTSDEPDSNPGNNSGTTSILIKPAADLSVQKTTALDEVVLGSSYEYHITITNHGPSQATNVVLTDTLPSGITDINITTGQGTYTQIGNIVTFQLGNIAVNASVLITIQLTPTNTGLKKNSVVVGANEADPIPTNNFASVCVYVKKIAGTDLLVTKTHTPEPASLCSPVLYTITVTNQGPLSATGIVLYDELPSSLELISIHTNQGTCCICKVPSHSHKPDCMGCLPDPEDCEKKPCGHIKRLCNNRTEIICQLGSLAVGESAVIKLCTKPTMIGNITNTAIVTENEEDTDLSNNEVTDVLTVITSAEQLVLVVAKIQELISLGQLKESYGKLLIDYLTTAIDDINSCYLEEAKVSLDKFMKKIMLYIHKEYLPKEAGYELAKAVTFVKDHMECICDCTKEDTTSWMPGGPDTKEDKPCHEGDDSVG